MKTVRQVNIKNGQHYLFNTMTNIRNFDPSSLSIEALKSTFKSTDFVIYHIEYITMKSLDNKTSLHLILNIVDAYIEKNNED